MADPIEELNAVFTTCGINDAGMRANIIAQEGWEYLRVLETDMDVAEMAKRMASQMQAEGRVLLGTVIIKCLQTLIWWVRYHQKRNLPLVAAQFNAEALSQAFEMRTLEKELSNEDPSVTDLALADFHTIEERRMYQFPMTGNSFESDNQAVFRKLKAFLIDSPGWAWIEPHDTSENGRAAYMAWTAHYNGAGELSKCASIAKSRLNVLHYRNKQSMSFENACN